MKLYFCILVLLTQVVFSQINEQKQSMKRSRIAVWFPDKFPATENPGMNKQEIIKACGGNEIIFFETCAVIDSSLKRDEFDLLVLPFGSSFPAQSWKVIKKFIHSGGNLIVVGGRPFYQPVIFKKGEWQPGTAQPTFAHELLIGPIEEIKVNSDEFYKIKEIERFDSATAFRKFQPPSVVYEPVYRFSTKKDFEHEDGSAGTREALIEPVIHLKNSMGVPFAAPIVKIDRLRGSSAGGRWLFINCDSKVDADILKRCIDLALEGAIEVSVRPKWASYHEAETPVINVQIFKPAGNYSEKKKSNHFLRVKNEDERIIFEESFSLNGNSELRIADVPIKTKILKPGYYSVEVHFDSEIELKDYKSGFWIRDEKLLKKCPKISVSKDWLTKGDEPFPVIGTTYMASDVHRKFLFEPNPAIWMKDFRQMAELGVNFVRTGLWTGWSRIMIDPGAIDEGFLRAIEAFILCAARNNIPICFNFFAFTPPLYNGVNPYLDPRALEGQKRLLALVANRFKGCNWIHYDLINEPSYSPPNELWQNAPVGDHFEKAYWKEWVQKKFKNDENLIRDNWRDTSDDLFSIPYLGELYYSKIRDYRRNRKGMDFQLFTQSVVAKWAKELRDYLNLFSDGALVTLGQDESGKDNRPQHQFFSESVDYTSMHTWWLNDDLLWDGLFSKIPLKPNMIQETGLMRLEDIDGEPWRNPDDAGQMIRKKYALAFASRACGVIEWAWNINPYMPIDNESVIGFFRPEGTAKKELITLIEIAQFFDKISGQISDYSAPEVAVVIPNSKIFSARPTGIESTTKLTRVLTDYFGITPVLLSEYKLDENRLKDIKLVIIPSPELLCDSAALVITNLMKKGVRILVTGALEGNEYGKLSKEILALGISNIAEPVELREKSAWNDELYAIFDSGKREYLKKAITEKSADFKALLTHEPLPLELSSKNDLIIELLKKLFDSAGINYNYSEFPCTVTALKMNNDRYLVVAVNESSIRIEKDIELQKHRVKVKVKPSGSSYYFIDAGTGKIIEKLEN